MKKDESWKKFFSDNERYADVINAIGCRGMQVVKPEDLQEIDTASGKKARDLLRKTAFGVNYAIIGIENQEERDYELPLRILSYEIGEYQNQAGAIYRQIRSRKRKGDKNQNLSHVEKMPDVKKLSSGEYLYGFRKEDRLHPVITFVLYAGKEKWDGPLSLHDILEFSDIPDGLKALAANYKVKLIDVRRMKNTDIFKTDVKYAFDFIRSAENKQELYQLVMNEPYYQEMDKDTYELIRNYANLDGLLAMDSEEGGKRNMCKAIRDLMEDSREEGEVLVSKLIQILLSENRMDDIDRVTRDKEYRAKLFKEFQIL